MSKRLANCKVLSPPLPPLLVIFSIFFANMFLCTSNFYQKLWGYPVVKISGRIDSRRPPHSYGWELNVMSVDNLDDSDPLPALHWGVKEHNLCIRIDIEKIPPEEGCGKVNPGAETLVPHKMSPLLPGRLPTDRFWPEVVVAGRLVSDNPERSYLSSRTIVWCALSF